MTREESVTTTLATPSMRERFDVRAALPRLPRLLLGLVTFGLGIVGMDGLGQKERRAFEGVEFGVALVAGIWVVRRQKLREL